MRLACAFRRLAYRGGVADKTGATPEMAGALARFWSGGEGPSHSSISTAFALAGYVEQPEGGNKQERVLTAIRDADPETARKLVEELLDLLRRGSYFEADANDPPIKSLRTAIARAGHSLTEDRYITWDALDMSPKAPVAPRDIGQDPEPATSEQQELLKSILDVFRVNQAWPTVQYVTTVMDQRGIDLSGVLAAIPVGWVIPDPRFRGGAVRPQPSEEMRLTILGAYRCPGAGDVLSLFLRGLEWGIKRRQAYVPSPTKYAEPEWTFSEFLSGLKGETVPTPIEGVLTLEMMKYEPDLPRWSGPLDDPTKWTIHIPADIKRWRPTTTIEQYVRVREAELRQPPTIPARDHQVETTEKDPLAMASATVFVVHGHAAAPKHEVARVLMRLTGREAIILHEQPNRGQTVIEKFEKHARTAAFAVVLLTGDDVGGSRSDPSDGLQPRARQNVVFELGFFVAAIGRERVVALYEPGVELPSDLHGILYTELDTAGAWKAELGRELRAAGITIDPGGLLG